MESTDEMVFLMGLPGSGKSTWMHQNLVHYHIIDPDLFKHGHPSYDPKHPERVHDWSKQMARSVFIQALRVGKGRWAVQTVGSNAEGMRQRVAMARLAGFCVGLIYIRCTPETALLRNQQRERQVPTHVIEFEAQGIEGSYESLVADVDYAVEVNSEARSKLFILRKSFNSLPIVPSLSSSLHVFGGQRLLGSALFVQ